jgi:diguanylate cyclase (GGDEF)-like protein
VVDAYMELLPALERSEGLEPVPRPVTSRPVNAGRALQAIAHAHRESVALYELSRTISRGLGVTETGHLLATGLLGLVPHVSCALFVPANDDRLVCSFACGTDAELVRAMVITPGVSSLGEAVAARMTLVNGDPQAEFAASGIAPVPTRPGLRSMLATPLVVDDLLVGALILFHSQPDFYGDDHRRVMEHVASHAAVVVQNARHFDQAREDSLTDPLTGLPNTRFLLMHLTQELARASRQGSELALLVLDLDDFKKVNDSAGHWAGDRVLCQIARALSASIRPYDVCTRYAGDEFIIMLPECGQHEAEDRRQQLESTVRSVAVDVGRGRLVSVTASVGAAVFPMDGDTYESLLAAADARMYAMKHGQRRTASMVSGPSPADLSTAGAA